MFLFFVFFFFKQKTAYEIGQWLEFRRVLFRSIGWRSQRVFLHNWLVTFELMIYKHIWFYRGCTPQIAPKFYLFPGHLKISLPQPFQNQSLFIIFTRFMNINLAQTSWLGKVVMLEKFKNIYFVGIGGIGMSAQIGRASCRERV